MADKNLRWSLGAGTGGHFNRNGAGIEDRDLSGGGDGEYAFHP